jgi:hypothetical protein
MRSGLPRLLALLLGVGAALLVACGGGGTRGGIPAANAGELKSQLGDVQKAVDDGRCDDLPGQLRQVDDGVDALPATVDQRLRDALGNAADRLRQTAVRACGNTTTTQTQTQTQPESVPTQTQTQTQTTPTRTQTQTTPERTTTVEPPATTPPPPPPVVTNPSPPPVEPPIPAPAPAPPPAPGAPSGGAQPGAQR